MRDKETLEKYSLLVYVGMQLKPSKGYQNTGTSYHPRRSNTDMQSRSNLINAHTMLSQEKGGILCLVRFASQAFTLTESHRTTKHQELFLVKWGLEQLQSYILGQRVKVVTDHANLKWLTTMVQQQAKVAR